MLYQLVWLSQVQDVIGNQISADRKKESDPFDLGISQHILATFMCICCHMTATMRWQIVSLLLTGCCAGGDAVVQSPWDPARVSTVLDACGCVEYWYHVCWDGQPKTSLSWWFRDWSAVQSIQVGCRLKLFSSCECCIGCWCVLY